MSRNIAIKEGDNPKTFNNVKKIIIKNTDGSNGYWIPDSLGTKHINQNGTYKASEEKDEHDVNNGWVGYSEVTVSGIGVASGIGEDGNEHMAYKDENDNLQEPVAPSSIRIIVPPAKMGYRDGDLIDITGIGVKAYLKDGTAWEGDEAHPNGMIPITELGWEPDKAKFEGESDEWEDEESGVVAYGVYCDKYVSGSYINGYHCDHPTGLYSAGNYRFLSRYAKGYIFYTRYGGYIYGCGMGSGSHSYGSTREDGSTGTGTNPSFATSTYKFDNSFKVGENNNLFSLIKDLIPISEVDPHGKDFSHAKKVSVKQTITIKWNRNVDGVTDGTELTTTLEVTVFPEDYQPNPEYEGGGGGSDF